MRYLLALLLAAPLVAADYDIGPGQPIVSINDMAWETLAPGDTVRIHHSPTPYAAHFVLAAQGTQAMPITVSGVPGPGGELPVITGDSATTRLALDYWNDERGVIKIGGSSIPNVATARWIVIENLHVTAGRPAYSYTDDAGNAKSHAGNCAAIFLEQGQNITIRNCELSDSANGLFVAAGNVGGGQPTQNVLVERCYIHNNGEVGDIFVHNTYTEADGITYQYNRFGPLRAGCLGNNLKDRSAGCVIRYNWIESGNRQLDLVETDYFMAQANYASTFVYGNILIEPDGAGNRQIIHYGGDGGDTSKYRKGWLYLFNNTLVSTRVGRTTLVRLSTNDESCDCRNNIIYVTDTGNQLELISDAGILDIRNNWFKAGFTSSFQSAYIGTVNNLGNNIGGTTPGFENEGTQDFELDSGSVCRDAGVAPHAQTGSHPPGRQYVKHGQDAPRALDADIDIGAFEFGVGTPLTPPLAPVALEAWVFGVLIGEGSVHWTDTCINESGFRIERRNNAGAIVVAGTASMNATSFIEAGVQMVYPFEIEYRVIAYNADGDSQPSNWVRAIVIGGGKGHGDATSDDSCSVSGIGTIPGLFFVVIAAFGLLRTGVRRRGWVEAIGRERPRLTV